MKLNFSPTKAITKKRALKLLGISHSTYRTWGMEVYYKCTHSLKKICSHYPQQLTLQEVKKMHRMLMHKNFLHWPILSVAYYSARHYILKAHPNTWYKYTRFTNVKRILLRKVKIRYPKGIKARFPDQYWHADVTQLCTLSGRLFYIYLVMDNFSRYILSWRVSEKLCAKTRLDTFEESIAKLELKRKIKGKSVVSGRTTQLIVDGGSENNNGWVDQMLRKYPKSVKKIVAMGDVLRSNSMY